MLGGCDLSINSPIVIDDGESRSGSLATVNGDITIGKDCTIEGGSTTVTGSLKVGDRSNVKDLSAVNGSIRIGGDVSVEGDVVVKRNTDVRLVLHEGSKVLGQIDGAEVFDN